MRPQVHLFGAHVAEWAEDGQEGFLYLSSASAFDEKTPIRGGEGLMVSIGVCNSSHSHSST